MPSSAEIMKMFGSSVGGSSGANIGSILSAAADMARTRATVELGKLEASNARTSGDQQALLGAAEIRSRNELGGNELAMNARLKNRELDQREAALTDDLKTSALQRTLSARQENRVTSEQPLRMRALENEVEAGTITNQANRMANLANSYKLEEERAGTNLRALQRQIDEATARGEIENLPKLRALQNITADTLLNQQELEQQNTIMQIMYPRLKAITDDLQDGVYNSSRMKEQWAKFAEFGKTIGLSLDPNRIPTPADLDPSNPGSLYNLEQTLMYNLQFRQELVKNAASSNPLEAMNKLLDAQNKIGTQERNDREAYRLNYELPFKQFFAQILGGRKNTEGNIVGMKDGQPATPEQTQAYNVMLSVAKRMATAFPDMDKNTIMEVIKQDYQADPAAFVKESMQYLMNSK